MEPSYNVGSGCWLCPQRTRHPHLVPAFPPGTLTSAWVQVGLQVPSWWPPVFLGLGRGSLESRVQVLVLSPQAAPVSWQGELWWYCLAMAFS